MFRNSVIVGIAVLAMGSFPASAGIEGCAASKSGAVANPCYEQCVSRCINFGYPPQQCHTECSEVVCVRGR